MSIEIPLYFIQVGSFRRENAILKYSEKERQISFEMMEEGIRSRMSLKNWDIAKVHIYQDGMYNLPR